jgi:hypothetical protein
MASLWNCFQVLGVQQPGRAPIIGHMGEKKNLSSWAAKIFRNTSAIAADEFRFAFTLAVAAADLSTPVENPENFGLNLMKKDGDVMRVTFRDGPDNRAAFAIKQHCGENRAKFMAIMTRFLAMKALPFRNPWLVVMEGGMVRLHEAVLDAAADFPVNGHGLFSTEGFYKRVAELAATGDYEDDDN